jgi:hypothetical protein
VEYQKLDVENLWERHVGVSRGLALAYAEALSVCLQKHHTSPLQYDLRDDEHSREAIVEWNAPADSLQRAWGNEIDVVESAAYGLALAAMELTRGLVAIGRAETKSGADYYLGTPGEEMTDLESAKRLEVSGVGVGSETAIRSRLTKKLAQAARGTSDLPAIASVVGFEYPVILSADLVEI